MWITCGLSTFKRVNRRKKWSVNRVFDFLFSPKRKNKNPNKALKLIKNKNLSYN